MFKEVLVRGCLGKHVTSQMRAHWCGWLKRIFQQEGKPLSVTTRGEILRVALGESETIAPIEIRNSSPPVTICTLGEATVQQLLEEGSPDSDDTSPPPGGVIPDPPSPSVTPSAPPIAVQEAGSTPTDAVIAVSPSPSAPESPAVSTEQANEVESPGSATPSWPPQPNGLGMIGQYETVRQLSNRLYYARDFYQRFKDTMFVGAAGVGKSSFARAISSQLLGQTPIMFSGADLRNGKMIIEKLAVDGHLPENRQRPTRLLPCVIFIDEVHALPPAVTNILLSALDDARQTTIDNVDYDFGDVVFLMATTDAGKLTEAFRSRPNRVLLRNYTLEELAGILWLHGHRELDGYSLPREVCIEIAARTRALPRVAVKTLTDQIVPHFNALVRGGNENPSRHRIAEVMTVGSVAAFFEDQGVDLNGLDNTARNFLAYLSRHGATAEERLRQGLGISNRGDFIEVDEYLQRLNLVTVKGGRTLTREGRRYCQTPFNLRHRISRQN